MDDGTSHHELASEKLSLFEPLKAAPPNCALCADRADARLVRQFALLERLGAVTIVLAESLGAEAAKYPGSSGAAAFVEVARALRQTVALERRLEAEREAQGRRPAEERREAASPRRAATPEAARDETTVVGAGLDRSAGAAGRQASQPSAAPEDGAATSRPREDLLRDLRERPEGGDAVDELRGLPSGEVVGRICQMLGIQADLSCFSDREMGRLAPLNHPQPPQPPTKLSDAAFEATLGRPSHRAPGAMGPEISPNARLQAIETAAADAVCGRGGHDPPVDIR